VTQTNQFRDPTRNGESKSALAFINPLHFHGSNGESESVLACIDPLELHDVAVSQRHLTVL
jgi:hypothetical protein